MQPAWSILVLAIGCGGDDTAKADATTDGDADVADADAAPPSPPPSCIELPDIEPGTLAPDRLEGEPDDGAMLLPEDDVGSLDVDARFDRAVQAGAMRDRSALLWTHVTSVPAGASLRLRVFREDGEAILSVREEDVTLEGSFAHVVVDRLAPATVYRYVFFFVRDGAPIARSPIGRFRTAFPAGARLRLRIGATACTGSANPERLAAIRPFESLTRLADDEELDLVLHLGDLSYNDRASTLDEYRAIWAANLADESYRAMLASHGWYATWDDHEVRDNYDPETVGAMRLEAAKRSFFEAVAVPRGASGEIYTSYRWGDTAEVFVLDARSERRPSTIGSAQPIFVSDAQLEWLKGALAASEARFKLVMTSVNISNLPEPFWIYEEDRWEGYGAQREALLSFIVERGIEDVWFLAGDIHVGFVGRVERSGPYASMWEITVGPGGSGINPLSTLIDANALTHDQVYPCDQFVFGHGKTEVVTTLELDPVAGMIRVRFVDAVTGEVMFDRWLRQ